MMVVVSFMICWLYFKTLIKAQRLEDKYLLPLLFEIDMQLNIYDKQY